MHGLDICLTLENVPIDYVQLLRDLLDERDNCVRKRDDAERELMRITELIRSTIRMLSPEQRSKIDCEVLLERLDSRPGLTMAIRMVFTAGKEWLTPVEIRDVLRNQGFCFDAYKANPLVSIHTTLRRMVPHEVECKTVNGQKIYRLKTVEQWRSSLADIRQEVRQWLSDSDLGAFQIGKNVVIVKRRQHDRSGPQQKD